MKLSVLTGLQALIMIILKFVNEGQGASTKEIMRIGDLILIHFGERAETVTVDWVKDHAEEIQAFIEVPDATGLLKATLEGLSV